MLELYYNSASRFEFFDVAGYDEDGDPIKIDGTIFPFGGTCVQQHSRWSDEWRVHLLSPFRNKGWLPLKHPIHGWLMTMEQALQLAREVQP